MYIRDRRAKVNTKPGGLGRGSRGGTGLAIQEPGTELVIDWGVGVGVLAGGEVEERGASRGSVRGEAKT